MNITPLTDQQLFDQSAAHLLKQGERCDGPDGCVYRDGYGHACAIGGVIPDELYHPLIEDTVAHALVTGGFEENSADIPKEIRDGLAALFANTDRHLMDELQKIHDRSSPEEWRDRLVSIADAYDLWASVLDQYP